MRTDRDQDKVSTGAPPRPGWCDRQVEELVADALAEATPRVAALALLRFGEYLALLRGTGIDVRPDGALGDSLRAGLRAVCLRDAGAVTAPE